MKTVKRFFNVGIILCFAYVFLWASLKCLMFAIIYGKEDSTIVDNIIFYLSLAVYLIETVMKACFAAAILLFLNKALEEYDNEGNLITIETKKLE